MNQIIAPANAIYCSEFMNELPKGIINKKKCGCGLTSLAIEDKYPTVIVVPTVEIIHNKEAQYPNDRCNHYLFGVYKGVDPSYVEHYLQHLDPSLPPKILVTYNSFWKVAQVIARNESQYRIVVDEFSELLDAYDYRDKAIDLLLSRLEGFSYVSYISATPMDKKYHPPQLQGIQETEIVWDKPTKIELYRFYTSNPYSSVAKVIENYRIAGEQGLLMPNGHRSKAAYFFLNSVNSIRTILSGTNLPASQVRVICADSEINQDKLGDYAIGSALDQEKPFNFITSKAFKGSDFYSESGAAYIVSNPHNKNTLISIDTDVKQISGRLRTTTNPFKDTVFHIFNTDSSLLSREKFTELVSEKTIYTNMLLSVFAKLDAEEYKAITKHYKEDSQDTYLSFDSHGFASFNEYLVNSNWRKWETSHATYCDYASIHQAYVDNDISINNYDRVIFLRKDFKELCIAYIDENSDRAYIAAKEPLVKLAYESLGESKMKSLCFRKKDIQKALTDTAPDTLATLERKVQIGFEVGKSYTLADTKTTLASIYAELGLKKTAKATDLKTYFAIRDHKQRVDGKSTGMIEILATLSA